MKKKKRPSKTARLIRRFVPHVAREVVNDHTIPFTYETVTGVAHYFRFHPKVLDREGVYDRGVEMLRHAKRTVVTVNTIRKEHSQAYVLHSGHDEQKRYFEELFGIVQKNRHKVGDSLIVIRYTNLDDEQKLEEAISLLLYGSDVQIYQSKIPIEFLIRDDEEVLLGFAENNELTYGIKLWNRGMCASLNRWIQTQSGVLPTDLTENSKKELNSQSLPTRQRAFVDAQGIAARVHEQQQITGDTVPDRSLVHALDLLAKIESNNPIEATKQAFDMFGDWYSALYQDTDYPHCYKSLADYLKQHLNNQHLTFLDVGCAHGTGSETLVNNGFQYWGVDLSEKLIRKAQEEGKHGKFIVDDMIRVLLDRKTRGFFSRGKSPYGLPDELDVIACQGNTFDFFLGDLQKWFALTLFKNRLRPNGILLVTQRSFTKEETQVERTVPGPDGPVTVSYNLEWSGDFVKVNVRIGDKFLGSVIQHPTPTTWLVDRCEEAGFNILDPKESLPKWFGPSGSRNPYTVFLFQASD
jgi:predicted TPR repeat methyltransferase